MTPFMLAVQARLDGEPAPTPATAPTRAESVAVATDTQVIIRSLAEQLVSEANAILAEHDRAISLVDETGPGALAFTLGYAGRAARVQTVLSGHSGTAQLVIAGTPADQPRRLTNDQELQSLLLALLSDAPLA